MYHKKDFGFARKNIALMRQLCDGTLHFFCVNVLTLSLPEWAIQSFLTFDSLDRTLKCDHSFESFGAVLYCGAVCFSGLRSL